MAFTDTLLSAEIESGGILWDMVFKDLSDWRTMFLEYLKMRPPQNNRPYTQQRGPGIVVAIANGYTLDGPGIESRWRRHFPHLSRPALGPTEPLAQWIPGLSRGKERPERDANPSLPSSAVVMKG